MANCNTCAHWQHHNGGTDGFCDLVEIKASLKPFASPVPAYYPGIHGLTGQPVTSYYGVKPTAKGWKQGLITNASHGCDSHEVPNG